MILCSISLATKSGILFVESEIHFFYPQELLNVIQSEAEQAERSKLRSRAQRGGARRSKAKLGGARYNILERVGVKKNEFQPRFKDLTLSWKCVLNM